METITYKTYRKESGKQFLIPNVLHLVDFTINDKLIDYSVFLPNGDKYIPVSYVELNGLRRFINRWIAECGGHLSMEVNTDTMYFIIDDLFGIHNFVYGLERVP